MVFGGVDGSEVPINRDMREKGMVIFMAERNKINIWVIVAVIAAVAAVIASVTTALLLQEKKRRDDKELERYLDCVIQ